MLLLVLLTLVILGTAGSAATSDFRALQRTRRHKLDKPVPHTEPYTTAHRHFRDRRQHRPRDPKHPHKAIDHIPCSLVALLWCARGRGPRTRKSVPLAELARIHFGLHPMFKILIAAASHPRRCQPTVM